MNSAAPPSAPPPPPSSSNEAFNKQMFGNLIRHWVHYDTMLSELNKQVKATRDTRNSYEEQALKMLSTSHIQHPVIQVGGGRLIVAQDRHQQPLNMKNLETLLQRYFREKQGVRDESAEIIKFIKANREVEVSQVLRRQRATSASSRAKDKDT